MKDFEAYFQQLSEIKETWEIYQIFEGERKKFLSEVQGYNAEIQAHQEILKDYRRQIREAKQELESIFALKQKEEIELEALKENKSKQKLKNIIKSLHQERQKIKEKKHEFMPSVLKEVEVYDQNKQKQTLQPVHNIYSEDLYKKYRVNLKESRELKNKVMELELENMQLKVEIRDFYTEMALKERMEFESKEEK